MCYSVYSDVGDMMLGMSESDACSLRATVSGGPVRLFPERILKSMQPAKCQRNELGS